MNCATGTSEGRRRERAYRHTRRRSRRSTVKAHEIRYFEAGAKGHLIVASGELDAHAAPSMRQTLAALADLGRANLVIDMSAATFIDSAMIGVLAGHLWQTRDIGGSLTVVCANENILRTLQIAGMDRELPTVPAISDALLERVTTMPRPHPRSALLSAPRTVSLRLEPDASELWLARGFAFAAGRRAGLDPRRQYNLALATNEAVANAIEHGGPCADGTIKLWSSEQVSVLTVGVSNGGEFVLEPLASDPLPERGRGLKLMRGAVDQVCFERTNDEIEVRLSIHR
jgi:anti-anti-sigma factor